MRKAKPEAMQETKRRAALVSYIFFIFYSAPWGTHFSPPKADDRSTEAHGFQSFSKWSSGQGKKTELNRPYYSFGSHLHG